MKNATKLFQSMIEELAAFQIWSKNDQILVSENDIAMTERIEQPSITILQANVKQLCNTWNLPKQSIQLKFGAIAPNGF